MAKAKKPKSTLQKVANYGAAGLTVGSAVLGLAIAVKIAVLKQEQDDYIKDLIKQFSKNQNQDSKETQDIKDAAGLNPELGDKVDRDALLKAIDKVQGQPMMAVPAAANIKRNFDDITSNQVHTDTTAMGTADTAKPTLDTSASKASTLITNLPKVIKIANGNVDAISQTLEGTKEKDVLNADGTTSKVPGANNFISVLPADLVSTGSVSDVVEIKDAVKIFSSADDKNAIYQVTFAFKDDNGVIVPGKEYTTKIALEYQHTNNENTLATLDDSNIIVTPSSQTPPLFVQMSDFLVNVAGVSIVDVAFDGSRALDSKTIKYAVTIAKGMATRTIQKSFTYTSSFSETVLQQTAKELVTTLKISDAQPLDNAAILSQINPLIRSTTTVETFVEDPKVADETYFRLNSNPVSIKDDVAENVRRYESTLVGSFMVELGKILEQGQLNIAISQEGVDKFIGRGNQLSKQMQLTQLLINIVNQTFNAQDKTSIDTVKTEFEKYISGSSADDVKAALTHVVDTLKATGPVEARQVTFNGRQSLTINGFRIENIFAFQNIAEASEALKAFAKELSDTFKSQLQVIKTYTVTLKINSTRQVVKYIVNEEKAPAEKAMDKITNKDITVDPAVLAQKPADKFDINALSLTSALAADFDITSVD